MPMGELAERYAVVLYELGIQEKEIMEACALLKENPVLTRVLAAPVATRGQKDRIIELVSQRAGFSGLFQRFLKKLCETQGIQEYERICQLWQEYRQKKAGCLTAKLYYVTEPKAEQQEAMKAFLMRRFGMKSVALQLIRKPELLGGFLLQAGDTEFDYSLRGNAKKLRRALTEETYSRSQS